MARSRQESDYGDTGLSREQRAAEQYGRERQALTALSTFLTNGKAEMARAIQKHMTPERMIRLALNAAARTPKLLQCNQVSIVRSLMAAGACGLEPDGREGHLVPFWNGKTSQMEAVFIPDYRGFVKLAYQSDLVLSCEGHAVRDGDDFEFRYGTDAYLRHVPRLTGRGDIVAAWAMVKFKDGAGSFFVLGADELNQIRNASQTGRKDEGPWHDWPDAMSAKSAFKALSKWVPLGPHFALAAEIDSAGETGDQRAALDVVNDLAEPHPGQDVPAKGAPVGGQDEPPQSESGKLRERVRSGRKAQQAATSPDGPADEPEGSGPTSASDAETKPVPAQLRKLPSESIDQWYDRMLGAIDRIPDLDELDSLRDLAGEYNRDEFLSAKNYAALLDRIDGRVAALENAAD